MCIQVVSNTLSKQNQYSFTKVLQNMSTQVKKANIFYIASDNSSDQQKNQQVLAAHKNGKSTNAFAHGLSGSHKLNNNGIAKGFFVQENHNTDYNFQKQVSDSKKTTLMKSLTLNQRLKSRRRLQTQNIQIDDESPKQQAPKFLNEIKNTKSKQPPVKKAKSIMFELDSDSDNEIHNNQQNQQQKRKQQEQREQITRSIQKSVENPTNDQEATTSDPVKNQTEKLKKQVQCKPIKPILDKVDKKQWVTTAIPLGNVLQCKIIKKNQISNFLLSQFDMFFRNYLVHTASCKKFPGSIGSNYRVSIDPENFHYFSNRFVGKVRSIQANDLYNIYDSGRKPQKNVPKSETRQILATVRIRAGKGPRNVQVYMLKQGYSYFDLLGRSLKHEANLEVLYSLEQNKNYIHLFKNRKPEWVVSKQQYFLNFNGRINEASIRNFILEDVQTGRQVMMFGKNTNSVYNIDISYPLSPMIGLSIAVPQLDRDD